MANIIISNTVTLTGGTQRLCSGSMVFSFRLTADADNTGDITVITPGGSYKLMPGASSEKYKSCDLFSLQVSGNAGVKIIYDGSTE